MFYECGEIIRFVFHDIGSSNVVEEKKKFGKHLDKQHAQYNRQFEELSIFFLSLIHVFFTWSLLFAWSDDSGHRSSPIQKSEHKVLSVWFNGPITHFNEFSNRNEDIFSWLYRKSLYGISNYDGHCETRVSFFGSHLFRLASFSATRLVQSICEL